MRLTFPSDTTLPSYYIIRNCILLTGAVDNWDDGNEWRLAAVRSPVYRYNVRHTLTSNVAIQESIYSDALKRSTEKNDAKSLTVLQGLRKELDVWARQRERDLQEYMLEQEGEDDDEETDSETDGVELDDTEEEAEMEAKGVELGEGNALLGGGDTQVLPIRGHQAPTASLVVNREDERSAILAATAFLFECQSYIPEHVQGQYTQVVLELQEVAMRSINSMSSTASAA
ncbi:uncharacterized protein J4E84_006492 [Alternaria hordeiaustralica]|uniref:uncharacterized protein n=1 Tax=Alternaria hordeiaustralica TaxID=1187925 RepID=UPI0020C2EA62|nr:uncharacterized protein J4E84_006492 [Alternaria hordeiaustralica]KAI4684502.1 hypothetical protein J4E84_006492 [Alternaria hordeiaustralica]